MSLRRIAAALSLIATSGAAVAPPAVARPLSMAQYAQRGSAICRAATKQLYRESYSDPDKILLGFSQQARTYDWEAAAFSALHAPPKAQRAQVKYIPAFYRDAAKAMRLEVADERNGDFAAGSVDLALVAKSTKYAALLARRVGINTCNNE